MFYLLDKKTQQVIKESECKNIYDTGDGDFIEGFASLQEILQYPSYFFSEYNEEIHEITNEKPKSLDNLKAEKLEELKNTRNRLDEEPILFKNKNIYELDVEKGEYKIVAQEDVYLTSDFKSKIMIKTSADMMFDEDYKYWKCEDNKHRWFSKAELNHVFLLIAERTEQLFIQEGTFAWQVDSCTTVSSIEKIKWEV